MSGMWDTTEREGQDALSEMSGEMGDYGRIRRRRMIEPWKLNAGKAAYEAYSYMVGGRAINGDPLPTFEDLPPKISSAWVEAGQAAIYSVPKVDV